MPLATVHRPEHTVTPTGFCVICVKLTPKVRALRTIGATINELRALLPCAGFDAEPIRDALKALVRAQHGLDSREPIGGTD